MFKFSIIGERRFIACPNRSGIRLRSFDAFNFGTTNWAISNVSLASFNHYPVKPCITQHTIGHRLNNAGIIFKLLCSYCHHWPITKLQPFLLLLETLDPRLYLPAAHAPDINESYAICSDPLAKITKAEIDLQLTDNKKGNTSLDWQEL